MSVELEVKTSVLQEADKRLTKRGGITIPMAMRRDLVLEGGDRFTITTLGNGDIYLKRLTGRCHWCGKIAVRRKGGMFLCDSCLAESAESGEKHGDD